MKTSIPPVLITIGLVCFALVQNTQAVVPAPDGGYPRGNTAEGQNALFSLTNDRLARDNTAIGEEALYSNTTGGQNTANGYQALFSNDTGSENTAVGDAALLANTGIANTAIGKDALKNNTTGSESTAIGEGALKNDIYGVKNTALGDGAGYRVTTAHDVIAIGTLGANVSLSCFIGHIRGIATANADAIPVLIDSAGQLGTLSSSRRFKKEIKPMDKASESLLALKPVTFHYKSDKTNRPEFGLIAEEVAEVNPDLVVRDEKGEIYTVRYDAVNAMLLNEFLKEHRKVEEQQATITELKSTRAQQQKDFQATVAHQQKQIEALSAGLQKVSAQLETSKPAPQLVNNNLSKAGWRWGYVSAVNAGGRTIFVADAHRDGGKRFVVRADEKLSAFMELESAICACGE
jgi:Chaperone of endosialidase